MLVGRAAHCLNRSFCNGLGLEGLGLELLEGLGRTVHRRHLVSCHAFYLLRFKPSEWMRHLTYILIEF